MKTRETRLIHLGMELSPTKVSTQCRISDKDSHEVSRVTRWKSKVKKCLGCWRHQKTEDGLNLLDRVIDRLENNIVYHLIFNGTFLNTTLIPTIYTKTTPEYTFTLDTTTFDILSIDNISPFINPFYIITQITLSSLTPTT